MRRRREDPTALSDALDGAHRSLRDEYKLAAAKAHDDNQARRARVLAHDDLAQQVAQILRLESPAHWNGYVPPRSDAEDACRACAQCRCPGTCRCCRIDHFSKINGSPIRAALVEVSAEALRREQEASSE